MSLIIDLAKVFVVGVVLFFAAPLALRPLPWESKRGILETYWSLAMTVLGRGLFVRRSHGGMTLKRTKFVDPPGAEICKLGGEWKYWRDPRDYMTTFQGREFGLAPEDRDVIVNARMAALGRRYRNLKRTGEWIKDGARKAYFALDDAPELVDINDAIAIIQGSANPSLPALLDQYQEIGQEKYNSRRAQVVEVMEYLLLLGGGVGVMYLAAKLQTTTGGGTGVSIPI